MEEPTTTQPLSEMLPPPASTVSPEELQQAEEAFLKGKGLVDDDPEEAVRLLCSALETRVKHFGEMAKECAEYYLFYGIALYEQTLAATDVLGQKMQNNTEAQAMERDSRQENRDPNAQSSRPTSRPLQTGEAQPVIAG